MAINTRDTPRIHDDAVGGIVKVVYDFDTHGGAVGANPINFKLPANAIILDGLVDVITAPTSGDLATVALTLESAGDLLAATAIADVTGQLNLVADGTAANAVKTTAERTLAVTIATAALTAGKMNIFIRYFLSD